MKNHRERGDNVLSNSSNQNIQKLRHNEIENNQKIGNLLRYFRKKNGVTQTELANVACISPQQIQKYEKGLDRIAVSRLITFLDFLNISLEDFIKAINNPSVPLSAKNKIE